MTAVHTYSSAAVQQGLPAVCIAQHQQCKHEAEARRGDTGRRACSTDELFVDRSSISRECMQPYWSCLVQVCVLFMPFTAYAAGA
jgi:hypothetical protein